MALAMAAPATAAPDLLAARGGLPGASSLAVTGSRVYVAAYGAGRLFALRRPGLQRAAATGAPPYALDGTAAVAATGRGVFVASGLGRSLTRFTPAGRFGACVCDDAALTGASGVAVAGRDIYVTAFDAGAVVHLRVLPDGALRRADCLADGGGFGCRSTPANVLEGASAVTVAGRDVYVTASRSDALVRLRRRPDGSLRYVACVADGGANDCARPRRDGLTAANAVAVRGQHVYVAAQVGTVTAFSRALRFERRARGRLLRGASGLAVAGPGLWVAAPGADAAVRLDARLRRTQCLARAARGCARGRGLDGVYAVAVRGRDLFTASPTRGVVAAYRLDRH